MEKSTVRIIIRVVVLGLMMFFIGRSARMSGVFAAEGSVMQDVPIEGPVMREVPIERPVTSEVMAEGPVTCELDLNEEAEAPLNDETFQKKVSEIVIDDYERLPADGGKTDWAILVDTEKKNTRVCHLGKSGWTVELDVPCVVGTASTPTPKGTFEIYQMHDGFYLNGHFWAYMSAFSGNYGFHSVPYDGEECIDSRLGEALSHGCIRLARDDAKWIQENVPLLTTVVIF